MKAILFGATGLTGSILLEYLLEDDTFQEVLVFSRKELNAQHQKLQVHICNLLELDAVKDLIKGDVVFINIGTTLKKTPDKALYYAIDHGIPTHVARIASANGVKRLLVVSSMGADAKSSIFYNRTKGQMEQDVLKNGPKESFIFRPSLIDGPRPERRFAEEFGIAVFRIINVCLVGPFRKYRMIKAEYISKAMQLVGLKGYSKPIISSDEIYDIVHTPK